MSLRNRFSYTTLAFALTLWSVSAVFSQPTHAQAPMRQMAARVAAGPIKLDIQPAEGAHLIGTSISLKVLLLNAENQPATWDHPCSVNLEVTLPSRKVEKLTVQIPKGQNSGVVTFLASEYGVTSLRAAETTNSLLPAGNSIFVVSAAQSQKHKFLGKKPVPHGSSLRDFDFVPAAQPRLTLASWNSSLTSNSASNSSWLEAFAQDSPTAAPAAAPPLEIAPVVPPSTPQLLLVNSTGKLEILADGKDFARVKVFYMAPDGKGAPSDILLWMSQSNGDFKPQPMVIRKGQFAAEGRLVSSSPLEASVSLAKSAPNVPVQGSSTIKMTFSPPIYGFGPATTEQVVKMSLIDREPLVGCFFDGDGQCIQTDRKRHVNVSSTNPSLHVEPDSFDIDANQGTATFFLEPTWRGTANLEMWTPGHTRQRIVIEISIWLVVTLCLIGGTIGGIAAKGKLAGSVWWRIFIGIVAAIVLVWLCVYAVLPQTSSMIAHSLISVLVVGIVGGYLGTQVLDFAGKKLGII